MPDAVTHAVFASDLKDKLDYKLLSEYENYYILGSQGPDPYFYHNFLPWKSGKEASKIGNLLHHIKTKDFLDYLVQHATTNEAQAFTLGMLTHYALDTNCHPYIYHVTGLFDSLTKKNRGTHLEFERAIDTIYIERVSKSPNWFHIEKHFFKLNTLHKSISTLLNQAIEEVHHIKDAGSMYLEAHRDFKRSFKYITYDPLGWKKVLLKIVDHFQDSSMLYQNVSSHKIRKEHIDYLNLAKNTWHHPVTNVPSNETFYDLVNKAKEFGQELLIDAVEYFLNQDSKIFKTIKNISYDTGLEIGHPPMKYFNEIL